jgi:hypothetical protein
MVNEFHVPIRNGTKKPLAIAWSGVGRELKGKDDGDNVNNTQYKNNSNCHYKSPLIMNIS